MDAPLGSPESLEAALTAAGLRVRPHAPLAEYGSFQLGGPCGLLIQCATPAELIRAQQLLCAGPLPAVLIGEGTNLLFSDSGWPGAVLRFVDDQTPPRPTGPDLWTFSAGMRLEALTAWTLRTGRGGLEFCSGIPGTLGGAVVGNAGAWGRQMQDVVTRVWILDAEGALREWSAADCGFAYRHSALKEQDGWVVEVEMRLSGAEPAALAASHADILLRRAARHPDWRTTPCIGSFFKNLAPTSAAEPRRAAGWFLEQAGAKSLRVGGAGVFAGHANIPVKLRPQCRAADVAKLARDMQTQVRQHFQIELEREVRYLGEIPGEIHASGFY